MHQSDDEQIVNSSPIRWQRFTQSQQTLGLGLGTGLGHSFSATNEPFGSLDKENTDLGVVADVTIPAAQTTAIWRSNLCD